MRIHWIDNAKAIGIFLIVLGHFGALYTPLKWVIYSFHVPLFLLITGYLMYPSMNEKSPYEFFTSPIKGYIFAFLLFSLLSIIVEALLYSVAEKQVLDFQHYFAATLYGVHGKDRLLMHFNGALWYFTFLVTSLVVYFSVVKVSQGLLRLVIVMGAAVLSFKYKGLGLPWNFDLVGLGMLFIYLGALAKEYCIFDKVKDFRIRLVVFIVIASPVLVFIEHANGHVNINRYLLGLYPPLTILCAVLGSFIIVAASMLLPASKLAILLSNNTMIIFCVHLGFVKLLRFLKVIEPSWLSQGLVLFSALAITMMCGYIGREIMPFMKRYVL